MLTAWLALELVCTSPAEIPEREREAKEGGKQLSEFPSSKHPSVYSHVYAALETSAHRAKAVSRVGKGRGRVRLGLRAGGSGSVSVVASYSKQKPGGNLCGTGLKVTERRLPAPTCLVVLRWGVASHAVVRLSREREPSMSSAPLPFSRAGKLEPFGRLAVQFGRDALP
ncbi:hypothetical protein SKAU_G00086880 [Synaphobranchus kaupii]|uniref:Secreted protein n=1 Tax=Synaphobranchus kaupii TaxID=118154 RepID=A0A9Q1FVX6_SYNKA|nr:hypothetical protein SKAU_G00086880 [Synaphobranchus kaupii]